MVQMLTIITMTVVGLLAGQASAQYNQQATLYSGQNSQGSFTNIIETYIGDLNSVSFDNRAYSTCLTGIWLFYENINFNPGNAYMEFFFGPSSFCANFNNVAGRVSSARFAGDPKDYRKDSLTLFKGDFFQGTEEYLLADQANLNLDLQTSSLIVTGASAWTVYDQPKFAGNAVCVYPPASSNFTPAFVSDTVNIGVPHATIRSIRKGCWSKKRVFAENITSGSKTSIPQGTSPNVNVGVLTGKAVLTTKV